MKKTLLFSTALLLSAATFAQTTVKNREAIKGQAIIQSDKNSTEANGSANASSSSSVHSDAVNNMENQSSAEIKNEHKAIVAEKEKIATEAKEEGQKSEKMVADDHTISTSAHSNTEANAQAKDNNISINSSINNPETLSSAEIKNKGNQMKNDGKAIVQTQADATVENSKLVKAKVHKTATKAGNKINTVTSTAVQAGAGTVHAVKITPVSIKTGAQVKTNTGIKIK
jgi:hypothetical protein